jgi:hypothetical protein
MSSTRRNEQNPEIVSKSEDFGFSAKFWSKLSFCKNRGDFLLIVKKGCDKINKGYQNLEFFRETLTIP